MTRSLKKLVEQSTPLAADSFLACHDTPGSMSEYCVSLDSQAWALKALGAAHAQLVCALSVPSHVEHSRQSSNSPYRPNLVVQRSELIAMYLSSTPLSRVQSPCCAA